MLMSYNLKFSSNPSSQGFMPTKSPGFFQDVGLRWCRSPVFVVFGTSLTGSPVEGFATPVSIMGMCESPSASPSFDVFIYRKPVL